MTYEIGYEIEEGTIVIGAVHRTRKEAIKAAVEIMKVSSSPEEIQIFVTDSGGFYTDDAGIRIARQRLKAQ